MMRTRHARTAARSDTASTTAPRSRTILPTSSAVSAVTPGIWLVTAPTGSGVLAGATTALWALDLALVALAAAMPWIASMRYVDDPSHLNCQLRANPRHSNSCRNSVALALLLHASKPGPDPMVLPTAAAVVAAAAIGLGHVGRPVAPLLGVPGTTATTRAALPADPRLGLATAATAAVTVAAIGIGIVVTAAQMAVMEATAITPVATIRTAAPPQLLQLLAPLLGTSRWALRPPDTADTRATAATALPVLLPAWVVLLPACRLRLLVAHRLAFLVDSTRSSSSTPTRFRLRLRLRLGMLRRLLHPWTCRPLPLALRVDACGRCLW